MFPVGFITFLPLTVSSTYSSSKGMFAVLGSLPLDFSFAISKDFFISSLIPLIRCCASDPLRIRLVLK